MRFGAIVLAVLLFIGSVVLADAQSSSAPLRVIMSGGFRAAYDDVLPEFQRTIGVMVTTTAGQSQGDTPTTIANQLRRGVPADVVIMSREGLDGLIAEGRIAKGTDVNIAQTPLGVTVRASAAKPDISTVEAFKKTLLAARAITFPSSTTGIYMVTKLFPQLGIADVMAKKTTNVGVAAVAKGDSDFAIQPVSELLGVPGTQFVGPVPKEIQFISVFSGAIVAGSQHPDDAKRLLVFLMSEPTAAVLRKHGMERVRAPSTR